MSLLLLAEALLVLPIARFASRRVRFANVAKRMGWSPEESATSLDENDLVLARKIGRAVTTARRIYRMKDSCLAESYTTKWMLARRGIRATLVFGWRIKGSAALAPQFVPELHAALHAWVETGGAIVCGENGTKHKVVSRYR